MASFNKVMIIGNLCADVDARPAGSSTVAHMRVAVNEAFKSKSGEKVERTVYVDVEAWDKQAENAARYLGKGSAVFVEGRLQMDEWTDEATGGKRSKLKIRADRVVFLTFKDKAAGNAEEPPAGAEAENEDLPF